MKEISMFAHALTNYRRSFGHHTARLLVNAFNALEDKYTGRWPEALGHTLLIVDKLREVIELADRAPFKWDLEKALERAHLDAAREISCFAFEDEAERLDGQEAILSALDAVAS